MAQPFAVFSDTVVHLVASAAPLLAAIRIAPTRHITGLRCGNDRIVTTDQMLPALNTYTVVLSNRALGPARPGARDAGSNLALLTLETPCPGLNPEVAVAPVGSVVIVLGADFDASPTVRLTVIHRFSRTVDGLAPVLDLPSAGFEPGCPVLDTNGRLIGLAALGRNGEVMVVPSAVVCRLLAPNQTVAAAEQSRPVAERRGWLGVSLQPITVPDHLAARVGQPSGRMVVGVSKGGPAETAGMRVGDVLLSLNGTSASGSQALRAFLGTERVGASLEVKLLRDGDIVTTGLTIGDQPD